MATPEGKVKSKVKRVLDKYRNDLYYNMPVPSGYGSPTLDYWGACRGYAFAIETKAPGKRPSPRQLGTIEAMERGGIVVFLIDGDEGCALLDAWITTVVENSLCPPSSPLTARISAPPSGLTSPP